MFELSPVSIMLMPTNLRLGRERVYERLNDQIK